MSDPVISAIIWALIIVLLATPVLRTFQKTFHEVRVRSPWPFDGTGSHWGIGRWMTDSVFGAAGFLFMMGLSGLFVLYGLGLLIVVVIGAQQAFARVWGESVAQTAQFVFTVGLAPILGFIFSMIVVIVWKRRRQWEEGLLEAWMILPYPTRQAKPGIWIGRIRRPGGDTVTVLSEITGVPPVPDKTTRWSQCSEHFPVNVPQTVDPPVPVRWYWAPSLSPFVVRWERQFTAKQRNYVAHAVKVNGPRPEDRI
ncbi:hypothetical protein [Sulfobacillus thermosulfidooxidans]|uniref:hypothetical protein n=1 Tax=Sulfobacillus thermosulfidooxidans TaxID=28034 RepID=UPI0006B4D0D6|nr:hypothetical protein [Sulfobacillus thermosulfidooxidans]